MVQVPDRDEQLATMPLVSAVVTAYCLCLATRCFTTGVNRTDVTSLTR